MSTVTRTHPELAASRHGFPLPLTGVEHADVDVLLRHAPIDNVRFHVAYEGEVFAVERRIEGVVDGLLDRRMHWAVVYVQQYAPAALEDLIGAPMGNGPAGLTGNQVRRNTAKMLVSPEPDASPNEAIVITDFYERIGGHT